MSKYTNSKLAAKDLETYIKSNLGYSKELDIHDSVTATQIVTEDDEMEFQYSLDANCLIERAREAHYFQWLTNELESKEMYLTPKEELLLDGLKSIALRAHFGKVINNQMITIWNGLIKSLELDKSELVLESND